MVRRRHERVLVRRHGGQGNLLVELDGGDDVLDLDDPHLDGDLDVGEARDAAAADAGLAAPAVAPELVGAGPVAGDGLAGGEDAQRLAGLDAGHVVEAGDLLLAAEAEGAGAGGAEGDGVEVAAGDDPGLEEGQAVVPRLGQEGVVEGQVVGPGPGPVNAGAAAAAVAVEDGVDARAQVAQDVGEEVRVGVEEVGAVVVRGRGQGAEGREKARGGDGGQGRVEGFLSYLQLDSAAGGGWAG